MKHKKSLVALCLVIFSCSAMAESSVVISGLSYHMAKRQYEENTQNPKDYNEMNIGLGIQYNDYRMVVFKNSFYKNSIAAMWTPSWELTDNLSVGVRLGGAVGYKDTPVNEPLVPVVGVEVDYQTGNLHHVLGTLGYKTLTYHIQVDF